MSYLMKLVRTTIAAVVPQVIETLTGVPEWAIPAETWPLIGDSIRRICGW